MASSKRGTYGPAEGMPFADALPTLPRRFDAED
jgi:hypothetical protein